MRQAGQALWNFYKNNGQVQDVAETLIMSGVTATGQALLTDMSPEEIALSTALGAAGALALRPAMARGGYAAGRALDKAQPNAGEALGEFAAIIPGTPQSVEKYKDMEVMGDLMRAKYNQNFLKPDGTERGFYEGTLGLVGRNYGDNIAQTAVAITSPMIFDQLRPGESKSKEIAKLEQALAELKGEA